MTRDELKQYIVAHLRSDVPSQDGNNFVSMVYDFYVFSIAVLDQMEFDSFCRDDNKTIKHFKFNEMFELVTQRLATIIQELQPWEYQVDSIHILLPEVVWELYESDNSNNTTSNGILLRATWTKESCKVSGYLIMSIPFVTAQGEPR